MDTRTELRLEAGKVRCELVAGRVALREAPLRAELLEPLGHMVRALEAIERSLVLIAEALERPADPLDRLQSNKGD